ncbi:insulinase family protein [Bacteroidales bacterium OttesenSCG-928-B11]|nr:insulinase family protein [Bacteroidales bacterium OttesenSCG-928-B11]
MQKITTFLFVFLTLLSVNVLIAQKEYKYETVPNDPMNVRIYTLDNGLKVYLTVYREEPRIQCYIPVRVGSKNDPAETTGLAHYFEHMMFKGTPNFGTADWEKEKPMIDEIERLFEQYRKEADAGKRKAIYHIIDSISYEASKLAIANEYDKLMKSIGSKGTNAGTSNDYTVYMENIPANQLENWAVIQADRFKNPVLRLFHTELETIYEEKNMSLTNDGRRANEAMLAGLFPNHPYGQQTTLGSQEHLRNPSMTNINKFFKEYYVANNMAVCLSGDFDFDEAIALIDKYFGSIPSGKVPRLKVVPEKPITSPVVKEVTGLEAENMRIAFRIDEPANSKEIYVLRMMSNILANGKAGLIDLNVNQRQMTYYSSAYSYVLADNSAFVMYGTPKSGQTLDEVKELLLAQLELVKKGQFDDWLLEAAINNMRLNEMRQLESNSSRGRMLANAFQNNIPWSKAAKSIDNYSKITKKDIVDFANKHFKSDNYVLVYKRQGQPTDIAKIDKPVITEIVLNRDAESDFYKKIQQNKPENIAPVFVDFEKEITFDNYKGCPVYYVKNEENQTFTFTLRFAAGEMNDIKLPIAMNYFDYLGTSAYTPEQIKEMYYRYAATISMRCSDDHSQISISGLAGNFTDALHLTMTLLADAQPNDEALANMVKDMLKGRVDAKSNQNAILGALQAYCMYGPEMKQYVLSEDQLKQLKSNELIEIVKRLLQYKPEIIYYGPSDLKDIFTVLDKEYKLPKTFAKPAPEKKFELQPVASEQVFFANYKAPQSRLVTYSRSLKFDQKLLPVATLYNQYFGGSMNAIVFQEMREKRSLAYSANSRFVIPSEREDYMYNYSFIATQNDKIVDAFTAFNELFNDMPQSEPAFNLAKDAAKNSIETNRISKRSVINTYIQNKRMGIDYDYRRDIYQAISTFTMQDIVKFNQTYIQKQPKTYMILSHEKEVDFDKMEKQFGKVTKLTLEEIFGY